MPVPPFTLCPGGFITVRTLDDGRTLIEGWHLNLTPIDDDKPRHETAYHWIATSDYETAATVAEFTDWLNKPLNTTA